MKQDTTHMRVYRRTLQNLRRIHAETGERLVDILDELVSERLEMLHFSAYLTMVQMSTLERLAEDVRLDGSERRLELIMDEIGRRQK